MKAAVRVSLALGVFIATAPALAQQAHDAHEHGVAELRVVSDGSVLEIELRSPLDNLVGFEHAPRTATQRKAMAEAERRLKEGGSLFRPTEAAGCAMTAAALDSPWLQGPRHDHGHDHVHAHAHAEHDGHAELVAAYRFECTLPERLQGLQLRLFEAFPRLREVRVEHATRSGQGAAIVKPGKADLAL